MIDLSKCKTETQLNDALGQMWLDGELDDKGHLSPILVSEEAFEELKSNFSNLVYASNFGSYTITVKREGTTNKK